MPDVRGKTDGRGPGRPQAQGFTSSILEHDATPTTTGKVVNQDPGGGTQRPKGSNVVLTVGVEPRRPDDDHDLDTRRRRDRRSPVGTATHGRHELPWRSTRDRWTVLVSEVMLHQTQVPRVAQVFDAFMAEFPTPGAMAAAGAAARSSPRGAGSAIRAGPAGCAKSAVVIDDRRLARRPARAARRRPLHRGRDRRAGRRRRRDRHRGEHAARLRTVRGRAACPTPRPKRGCAARSRAVARRDGCSR